MQLRKSFVMRIFLVLLAALLLLMTVSSVGVYSYSRQIVGGEFLRLNETSVSHLADAAGGRISQLKSFAQKIAGNSRILELSQKGAAGEREARDILENALAEFNASHLDGSALVEAHILTGGGLAASSYNSGGFSWQSVVSEPAFRPLLDGQTDLLLLPTSTQEGVYGIMGHTFQLAVTMRDLLTGEARGLVVLDISEVALYEQFREYQNQDTTIHVIDGEGKILSARNKREIGTQAEYTPEQLQQRTLEEQIRSEEFVVFAPIAGTQWLLVMHTPTQQVFRTLGSLRNVSLVLTLGCALVALVLVMLSARRISRRTRRIRDGMEDAVRGSLDVQIPVEADDEFGQIESGFNTMVAETGRLIDEVRQSERQKHIAQMDFLHAQINSHFIHNTLTSIRFMLEMDRVKEAGEMIFYFSRLLRQTLSRSTEFIPLREELDTLKSYVMLQSYRYQDVFEAHFDFAEETLEVSVPVLILQPVVENAIFHGASQHYSHIYIRSFRQGNNLIVTVRDDGVGIPQEKLDKIFKKDASLNRVGLRNVHQRIQLTYGEAYGLSVDSRPGYGTEVRFTLPMDTEGGARNEA